MFPDDSLENLLSRFKGLVAKFFYKTETYLYLSPADCLGPICIACSGGSDSVFLTLIFRAFFGTHFYHSRGASILHLNHNLRGEESFQDAEFVKKFAKYLGLNFMGGTLNEPPDKLSEAKLRDMRYEFFSRQMRAIGSKVLLLGQQQNDAAETLIMRLTRASGIEGLSAPREVHQFADGTIRLRPLLGIKKSEIEAILKQCGMEWRVDSSNLSCNYFRNVIRNVVLPELQKAVPQYDIVANIAASHRAITEACDCIEEIASYGAMADSADGLNTGELNCMPTSIVRYILHKWLCKKRIELRRGEFENLLDAVRGISRACDGTVRINAVHGDGVVLSRGRLMTIGDFENRKQGKANFTFDNWVGGSLFLPNGKTLSQKSYRIKNRNAFLGCNSDGEACVELAQGETLSVRTFDPNFNYVAFGHGSQKKLCKILGKETRCYLGKPMVLCGDRACWVPGLAVSELFKIKGDGEHALLLTYS